MSPAADRTGSATNRRIAGALLAPRLAHLRAERPIILALPRGGVPVAYEVARALGAPLDVLVVRRLAVPDHPEVTLGAVCEGGVTLLDNAVAELSGAAPHEISEVLAEARAEVSSRAKRIRGERPLPDFSGRTVLLVDDGFSSGRTAYAAVRALHSLGVSKVVLAAPVAAALAVSYLRDRVDELVVGKVVPALGTVGAWYDEPNAITEAEVVAFLERARNEPAPQQPQA
ncbi:MAG: phosphoribosyltransferase [Myxococcaceae bacterium]